MVALLEFDKSAIDLMLYGKNRMQHDALMGKRLALVLWAKGENGEDDVAMCVGEISKRNGRYLLVRESEQPPVEIRDEWLERIRQVPGDLKEILEGADYQLSLRVGRAEDTDGSLEPTGLKWPR
jgi:hypothetical protein